jgi:FkbM family methyltransferase
MSQLVSYAQNFEDVILHRALSAVTEGNYIDIGAQSANVDSVSRMFHEMGWHGVHVEPVSVYAEELRSSRPGDQVLQLAVGDERGTITFYELPSTGLSTVDSTIAMGHRDDGFEVVERQVPLVTLDDVFDASGFEQVHWLKIDVEGFEASAIRGWRGGTRPWVVVVESTLPLSQVQTHQAWEPMLIELGYEFAYFDGLNRFYVAAMHRELLASFGPGPNVFDDFSLSGMASQPFTRLLKSEIQSLQGDIAVRRAEIELIHAEFETFRRGAATTSLELTLAKAKLVRIEADAAQAREEFGLLNARAVAMTAELKQQRDSAYFWWVAAEDRRAELDAMKKSRSWRLTAPLRALRGGRVFSRSFIKYLVRALLARLMIRVVRRPALARPFQALLSLTPGLRGRLRNLGVAYGFIDGGASKVTILDIHPSVAHSALSLKASRVLDDLSAAIDGEGN